MMKSINNLIYWMKSIGCNVLITDNYISVNRPDFNGSDFNFCLPLSSNAEIYDSKHIKIDIFDKSKAHSLMNNGYIRDDSSDIQLIRYKESNCSFKLENIFISNNNELHLRIADFKEWCSDTYNISRVFDDVVKPYFIYNSKNEKIGKICLCYYADILGIYDFEIFKEYQSHGYGYKALDLVYQISNTSVFIETWEENAQALRLYKKSGFEIVDQLCTYTRF